MYKWYFLDARQNNNKLPDIYRQSSLQFASHDAETV